MEPKVPAEEASERLLRLQTLQNNITRKCLKNLVGARTDAFIEGLSRMQDGDAVSWKGRDPAGRIVNVSMAETAGLTGMMVPVKIVEAKKHSLVGERTGEPW
jgi:tRNA-2-methylthio-N6-dimethylallyladenosine synthase